METTFIVIARESTAEGGTGEYTLATRTVFETETAALCYAATISESRGAKVIGGDFAHLRVGEKRGTAAYWG